MKNQFSNARLHVQTWWVIFLSTLAMITSVWYVGEKFKPGDKVEYEGLCLFVLGIMLGQGMFLDYTLDQHTQI